jgi:ParB family transcriptional regulator, chromosome partitioning protein
VTRKRDQPYQRQIRTFDTVFSSKEPQEVTQLVPLSSIRLPAQQPRRYFEQQKMAQLVLSVKEHGILEPLLVRPLPDGEYELVAGERRYRAAKEVGLLEVPIVARELTDEEALQLALVENLLREDLNPVEETEGILQLLALKLNLSVQEVIAVLYRMQNEAKGKVTRNVTGSSEQEQVQWVFEGLGLMSWESFIRNRLPLRNLPEDVLEVLRQGKLAYTKAQVIARVKDEQARKALLEAATSEDLSLTQIKERIAAIKMKSADNSENPPSSLKSRVDTTYAKLKKLKLWDNPNKQERLEKLLAELEALVSEGIAET